MISLYCLPMQRNQYRSRMQSHSQNIGSGDSLSTPQKVQSRYLNNILPLMHSTLKWSQAFFVIHIVSHLSQTKSLHNYRSFISKINSFPQFRKLFWYNIVSKR